MKITITKKEAETAAVIYKLLKSNNNKVSTLLYCPISKKIKKEIIHYGDTFFYTDAFSVFMIKPSIYHLIYSIVVSTNNCLYTDTNFEIKFNRSSNNLYIPKFNKYILFN